MTINESYAGSETKLDWQRHLRRGHKIVCKIAIVLGAGCAAAEQISMKISL